MLDKDLKLELFFTGRETFIELNKQSFKSTGDFKNQIWAKDLSTPSFLHHFWLFLVKSLSLACDVLNSDTKKFEYIKQI